MDRASGDLNRYVRVKGKETMQGMGENEWEVTVI